MVQLGYADDDDDDDDDDADADTSQLGTWEAPNEDIPPHEFERGLQFHKATVAALEPVLISSGSVVD
eukprot:CAMPEP_0194040888 /NCGR_PEP_ID=MMETSP0009_2-20130614/12821_1 /TAXON_ID=210454 /ORGANISM="Grammatophora oceanica, Strain CCMP 410" /LENGTH=66 /DNA_ID=CAMNT_0038684177 /DNA_START=442 /DNA_END=643 /DNA_ORIENTATION=+